MICPKCHFDCPQEFAFCPKCGMALAGERDTRSALDRAIQRQIPKEYAERLLATRGQPHDERRVVTILFADIKGSTAMEARLDPEDAKEIILGAFEFLIAPIFRYEGTLVQLMGDAVLAFFGAPIAHEDDPERAIRAGLEITTESTEYAKRLERERGITGFNVRVWINTGLVVVGEVGSDLRVAYTAIGDAINLAARMEQNAEPGTVLVTEATHKLVAPLFETRAMPPLQVKGKAEPLQTYRVLAAKAVTGKLRGIAGLESPLVGREIEFAALREALERLQAGVGGIVTLVGEAGIGKSRLVAEMRKSAATSQGAAPQWVEGRCLSYGSSMAYLVWLDLLRAFLGVTVEDSPAQVRERLRARVQELCREAAGTHYPYLARLMSLPLDADTEARLSAEGGQQIKGGTFQAIEALLRAAARQRPLVLVCEDLHWADASSLELLEHVLALPDRASLLLVDAFRPDASHGSWQLRETVRRLCRHRHTDLELRPLSAADSQTLVGNLLRLEELPGELRQRIVVTAEGNPFFVEEVVRGLVDSGTIARDAASGRWVATREVGEIHIPDTLQGVLLARLDRLQEDTKRVLQMAAVIGRVFLYRVLEVIACGETAILRPAIATQQRDLDAHLLALQRQEMIRERARLSELEYIFKHELTREAAYNGILKKERRAFHRQVAEALERLFPERIEEQLGLLAHHWEQAGDGPKATEYLLRAGDQARKAYAHAEAVGYYQRALAFLKQDSDRGRAARTWMKLGQAHHGAFESAKAGAAYAEAFALQQQVPQGRGAPGAALPPAPHAVRRAYVDLPELTLDPGFCLDADSAAFIYQLFSGLVELTPEMDVLPDVAQSWEISEGGSRFVFHLRDDITWSDGTAVTAGDFEYAWKRVLHPQTGSSNASLLYDIKNAQAFHQGHTTDAAQVGVSARDPHTLLVELEGPTGYFLSLLGHRATFPVPRHAVEAHGLAWAEPGVIVTNGPFVLHSFQPDELLVLERNPSYRGGVAGNVQRVQWRLLPRTGYPLAMESYEADGLDLVGVATTREGAEFSLRHVAELRSEALLATLALYFVQGQGPCQDAGVRRALAMAIDRRQLPWVQWGGAVPATGGFVPPGMPGHSPGIGLPFDPQEARRLLAQAGQPRAPHLALVGLTREGWMVEARCVEQQWRQNLGVEVRWLPAAGSLRELHEKVRAREADVFIANWLADYPDPDNFLRVADRGGPGSGWREPTYERLVEHARRRMDHAERMRLYRQADRILVEEAAIVPLAYHVSRVLVKPWVRLQRARAYPILYKDVIIEPH